ncbi:MAG TPA: hypothetical protein PLI65_05740 [Bacteroidales bacterium]|nr:hypothetical protein [Bacteroidales bacterium]HRW96764.1 hypothetical protein [Bacteroidales bacterium]
MTRPAFLMFLLIFTLPVFAQFSLNRLRSGFFSMKDEPCGQVEFFERIKSNSYSSPVHQAYAGTAEAASAGCAGGPMP